MTAIKTEKANLIGLNALRGIAAVTIVIFHVHGIPNLTLAPALTFIQRFFGLGVPLFFVISAFSLFLSTSSRVGSEGWLSAYFIRRLMRIAPLFYLVAVFYLFFIPFQFGSYVSTMSFLGTISFLYNLMPGQHESSVWAGWTVGVEMLFYLIVPYLLIFVRNTFLALITLIAGLLISTVFYKYYLSSNYPNGYAYMSFMGSIGIFMYGIFGYFIYQTLKTRIPSTRKLWGRLLLIVGLILFFILAKSEQWLAPIVGNRSNLWGLGFALIVVSQCLNPVAIISNKYTAHLGKLSFGLYLCHPPIVYMLKPIYEKFYASGYGDSVAFLLSAAVTLTILIPVAQVASTFIERKGIALGESLIKRRLTSDYLLEGTR